MLICTVFDYLLRKTKLKVLIAKVYYGMKTQGNDITLEARHSIHEEKVVLIKKF